MSRLRSIDIRGYIWQEFEEDGFKHWDLVSSLEETESCNCGFCAIIEEIIDLRKRIEELENKKTWKKYGL